MPLAEGLLINRVGFVLFIPIARLFSTGLVNGSDEEIPKPKTNPPVAPVLTKFPIAKSFPNMDFALYPIA
jgi:hypothetical protein